MSADMLDDKALAQLELEIANRNDATAMESACGEYNCPCHYRLPALCQTVRALRFQVAQAEQAFELESAVKLPEVGNLNVLQIVKKMAELHETNAALRERLAQAQARIEKQDAIISAYENQDEEALAEAENL